MFKYFNVLNKLEEQILYLILRCVRIACKYALNRGRLVGPYEHGFRFDVISLHVVGVG